MNNLPFLRVASVRIRDGRNHYQIARQDKRFRATTVELSRTIHGSAHRPWQLWIDYCRLLHFETLCEANEHARKLLI